MLASKQMQKDQTIDGKMLHAPIRVGSEDASIAKPMKLLKPNLKSMATVAFLGKGGAGKSTLCSNLAVIAKVVGLKVGILDADAQASVSDWRRARGSKDIPVQTCGVSNLVHWVNKASAADIDWLFIDMPPGARHALGATQVADLCLVVARPNFFDVRVASQLVEILVSGTARLAIILNAVPPSRAGVEAPSVQEARAALSHKRLWEGLITQRIGVASAVTQGKGVIELAPGSVAASEYGALWNAVARDVVRLRRLRS